MICSRLCLPVPFLLTALTIASCSGCTSQSRRAERLVLVSYDGEG